jgi:cyclophilin family peptidyl-prolyl cis-trans isomerase
VGTNAEKRERQRQNRAQARAASGNGSRTRALATVAIVGAIVVVGLVVWLAGRSDDGDETVEATDEATSTTVEATGEPTPCPPVEGSPERVASFTGPPEFCIDPETTAYSATFVTSEGEFRADLDADAAPQTVNNFVVLSRYGYYDGVPFHRIVPGFVIQAGDGDGEPWGTNDLGYTIDDELPASNEVYTDYSLAMANAGPDTNGSQFFVVLPGGGAQLTAAYSWFGQVTEGQAVVDAIGALGSGDEQPTTDVLIESVDITETPR